MDSLHFYGKRTLEKIDDNDLSPDDILSPDENEYQPGSDNASSDDCETSSESSSDFSNTENGNSAQSVGQNWSVVQNQPGRKDNVIARSQYTFTGNSGLKKKIVHDDGSNVTPIEVFNQLFAGVIIVLMVTETN